MIRFAMVGLIAFASASTAFAGSAPSPQVVRLTLKDYHFSPDVITIPANQRVKIDLTNDDATGDDFESKDLQIDKEVEALGHVSFFVGPLAPGTYAFKAEKSAATAHGTIVVTATGQ